MRLPLLCVLLSLTLVACGGSGDDTPAAPPTVSATGVVTDERGVPLADALVSVVSASTVAGTSISVRTGADGRFSLTLDAAVPGVLRVDKDGHARGVRAAATVADNAAAFTRVVLHPVGATLAFDPTQDAVLRVPGSAARVVLSAGSLVRQDGQPLSGEARVALTPIDPSVDIDRMPGALLDAQTAEPIESLGAMSVSFTDASGAALNLASGRTAVLRIPATPAPGAALPATFPLYHLDERVGRWVREGEAVLAIDPVTGQSYYEGSVSHFSWWNADQVLQRSRVDVRANVAGGTCRVPEGTTLRTQGIDYNGVSVPTADGSLFARAGSRVRVLLLDPSGATLDSLELDTGAVGASVALPRCLAEPPLVGVSGRVTVVSGVLSEHRVQLSGAGLRLTTLPLDADGRYATRVYAGRGELRARLVGLDRGGPETSVLTTVGSTDAVFPDMALRDARFDLAGCVQGWSGYRRTSAQVSLFRDGVLLAEPRTVTAAAPGFSFPQAPLNSTLTLRLTAPDANLAEKTQTLTVGGTPVSPGACLDLPRAAQVVLNVTGQGLTRDFDASATVAGDASIVAFAWDFGDGGTAPGIRASHAYAAVGSYTVRLSVTDALGQISQAARVLDVTAGGALSTLTPATALDAGTDHACAVRADGVWCWGSNVNQQLGSPITVDTSTEPFTLTGLMSSGVPLRVAGLADVTAVSAGESHGCALIADGSVRCWGLGEHGQLGQGARTNSAAVVPVAGLTTAVAISAGGFGTCALLQVGSVSCWGDGSFSVDRLTPTPVAGLSGVTALSLGRSHACAVLASGGVRCWGDNLDGQLGDGSTTAASVPVAVAGLQNAVTVVAGVRHSCALLADGSVRCWGYRGLAGAFGTVRSGLMGDGSTDVAPALTPVTVTGLSTAVALATGPQHVCALLQDGSLRCWGGDAQARDVADATDVALSPMTVAWNGVVTALTLGDDFTCVSLADGAVQCRGLGRQGRLGTGGQSTQLNPNPSPYPEVALTPVTVAFP